MVGRRLLFSFLTAAMFIAALVSCSPRRPEKGRLVRPPLETTVETVIARGAVRRVAIYPLEAKDLGSSFRTRPAVGSGSTESIDSQTDIVGVNRPQPTTFKTSLDEELLQNFTGRLAEALDSQSDVVVINRAEAAAHEKGVAQVLRMPVSERDKALRYGQSVDADAVLLGTVTKYQEFSQSAREGLILAAVGFRLVLIDVRTGSNLWTASYELQDRTLNENILEVPSLVKRGGVSYKQAREMIESGFREAAAKLKLYLVEGR